MEGLTQILPVNGIMNRDDDHKSVRSSEGQVIERVNLRPNSIDGKRWVNEKIKGVTLIADDRWSQSQLALPAGGNKEIGHCNDYKNEAIIYFVYNGNGNHCIFRYYQKEKTIEKVWYRNPDLGFEDANIKAFVAGGMLYWVNGSQKPKSFMLDWAVNYTNPTANIGDGKEYTVAQVTNMDTDILPLIKRPPRYKPKAIYITQKSQKFGDYLVPITFNNLRRKQFQFKYKYTYLDNQESAYSPVSKVPLPPREVGITGDWDEDICTNNAISVTVNSGNSYVSKVTIAVRECQDRTALGDFYTFYELEKYQKDGTKIVDDDFDYEVHFLNDKLLENINTDINNRYFDDVPISASDIILLDGKYTTMAMPVKNYDLPDVTIIAEAVETEITESELVSAPLSFYEDTSHNYHVTIVVYDNSVYTISFEDHDHTPHSFSVNSSTVFPLTATNLANAIATNIQASAGVIAHFNQCTNNEAIVTLDFYGSNPTWGTFNAEVYIAGTEGQMIYKSLKRFQYHPFVIIYNDEFGRYNIAQGETEMFSPAETDCPNKYQVKAKLSIYNKPPVWAKTYRIGYITNKSYLYFLQVPFVEVIDQGTGETLPAGHEYEGYAYVVPQGYYYLKINSAIQRMREAYPNMVIADYLFQQGDRARVVCNDVTLEIVSGTVTLTKANETNVEFTEYGYLVKRDTDFFDGLDDNIPLLEIYRPNTGVNSAAGSYNNIFFETGDEYDILDWGTDMCRHGVTNNGLSVNPLTDVEQTVDINGVPITPAEIRLDFGDVYVRGRAGITLAEILDPVIVEDTNYTDFFASSGIDLGRITAKIDSEQKELNSLVRGELFIEGTKINWLNVFLAQTVHFDASEIYGRITGIKEVGGTLKVIQEHKEESIMIGQVTMKQADMGDWIFIGDTVFGAHRRYEEDRGSTYARSIVSNNRYIYYFDESTGEFIRSSPNGQAPVSKEYLHQNWFEKKAKQLREFAGDKDVVVSCDNDYEEVYVSFRLADEIETIVFSEKEGFKGWTRFGTYFNDSNVPENFTFFKDTLVSFMNGQLYLHNQGNLNTFYGKVHGCSLTVPVNQYSSMMKRYSSIRMSTDKNIWNIEFRIDEGVNYPNQKSILRPSILREKENAIYSDILRNIVSRAGVEDLTLIHNGTRMVGEYMDVEISNETNEEVNLGIVQVNFLIAK